GRVARTTAGLAGRVDAELRRVQAGFKPIAARRHALAPAPTAGGAPLLDGQRELRELLERGKLVGAAMLPLREESALLHRYATDLEGWQQAIDRQIAQDLRGLGVELAGLAVALAVILTAGMLGRMAAVRYVAD